MGYSFCVLLAGRGTKASGGGPEEGRAWVSVGAVPERDDIVYFNREMCSPIVGPFVSLLFLSRVLARQYKAQLRRKSQQIQEALVLVYLAALCSSFDQTLCLLLSISGIGLENSRRPI